MVRPDSDSATPLLFLLSLLLQRNPVFRPHNLIARLRFNPYEKTEIVTYPNEQILNCNEKLLLLSERYGIILR